MKSRIVPLSGFAQTVLNVRNRYFLAIDLALSCLTPWAALLLRTESLNFTLRYAEALALYALIAIVIRLMVFIPFGLYSRYWRYASIDELAEIIFAVTTSTIVIALVFFGILRPFGILPNDFPRSIPFIDGLLAYLTFGGVRFSVRLYENWSRRNVRQLAERSRVLVLGAGDAGVMIVKEMWANPQLGLEPVGFLDDDPRKHNSLIQGLRVVGDRSQLAAAAQALRADTAIIAMPTSPGKTIRELITLCHQAELSVKTVPGIFELLDGSVTVNQLRDVDIADLLRREPVETDSAPVARLLRGKWALVTGAGGSIGSELCRQIARADPAGIVLLGHGENSIFAIANELRHAFPRLALRPVIADIRDAARLRTVFARYHPQVIFHAAAHKHVPLMEANAEDAITNNVLGTRNLLQVASESGVEQFVAISSDKAVNPSSVMGATKRVAELLVQDAAQRTGRRYVAVRFGNVLGSRGSVVPIFKQQIATGGPITITHPDVRRYFMTIPEAVQLVLQAATLGRGGEIFALDMGEPVSIIDLARDLIRLSGLEEGRDIEIKFTGLRPGEKLVEELFLSSEQYGRTTHEKVLIAHQWADPAPGSGSPLHAIIDRMQEQAEAGDVAEIGRLLRDLVPEYQPNPEVRSVGNPPLAQMARGDGLSGKHPAPAARPADSAQV